MAKKRQKDVVQREAPIVQARAQKNPTTKLVQVMKKPIEKKIEISQKKALAREARYNSIEQRLGEVTRALAQTAEYTQGKNTADVISRLEEADKFLKTAMPYMIISGALASGSFLLAKGPEKLLNLLPPTLGANLVVQALVPATTIFGISTVAAITTANLLWCAGIGRKKKERVQEAQIPRATLRV